ncbi:MAG: hypothetical protein GF411_07925 [Candidatus Lokiarchaeota archaeon]|nr:hypothetical protein [Candidatus Lokiarchaeota archaeon]
MNWIEIHRYISWTLVIASIVLISTGYAVSRGLSPSYYYQLALFHRIFEMFFIPLLILHMSITIRYYRINWRKTISLLRQNRGSSIHSMRLLQRLSSWLIVFFAVLVIIPGLNGYDIFAEATGEAIPFSLHRFFDVFLVSLIIIHSIIGVRFVMMRKRIRWRFTNHLLSFLTIGLVLAVVLVNVPQASVKETEYSGTVIIGSEEFSFQASDIDSLRPDIFTEGHFSMFDILVHISNHEGIELEYHFNETMNTFVVESINGEPHWWYRVIYSGGWPENNVFRMDHYPWKPETEITFYKVSKERLDETYAIFREEIERKLVNDGELIIPEVTIRGKSFYYRAENVSVTAHNLRNDTFQTGVITAIDVIMSLGDKGDIFYDIAWFESIGDADVVQNYYIVQINSDRQAGTCGFVYESGDLENQGLLNHIHLPSDSRVLNAPEYVTWYWICL